VNPEPGRSGVSAERRVRFVPAVRPSLERVLKLRGVLFSRKRPDGEARRQEHTRQRSVTEEQRSQSAFCAKTLRAVGLVPGACVGSALTARCGDAPASPPWPQPKSLAAGPHVILKQALCVNYGSPPVIRVVAQVSPPVRSAYQPTTTSCSAQRLFMILSPMILPFPPAAFFCPHLSASISVLVSVAPVLCG